MQNLSALSRAGSAAGIVAQVLGKVFLAARLCPGQLTPPRQRAKAEGHERGKS